MPFFKIMENCFFVALPEPGPCGTCQDKEGENFGKHFDNFLSETKVDFFWEAMILAALPLSC